MTSHIDKLDSDWRVENAVQIFDVIKISLLLSIKGIGGKLATQNKQMH